MEASAKPHVEPELLGRLRISAKLALDRCYAPYSGFMVVAAVETADGEVFGGANVEVANYSLTKHAEEAATMAAIAAGAPLARGQWLRTIYVLGGAPCGSCRQFLWEFATPNAVVVLDKEYGQVQSLSYLRQLLPEAFGPEDLKASRRKGTPPKGLQDR